MYTIMPEPLLEASDPLELINKIIYKPALLKRISHSHSNYKAIIGQIPELLKNIFTGKINIIDAPMFIISILPLLLN